MSDIFEFIQRKKFLETLFPIGLTEPVLIGQVTLSVLGYTILSLHTRQRPAMEVVKWGEWGKDYNVVVINLLADAEADFCVFGWTDRKYLPIDILLEGGWKFLVRRGGAKNITIEFSEFIFQKCDTYLE